MIAELDALALNLRKKSKRTKGVYFWACRLYMGKNGHDFSRSTMLKFMDWLESAKYSANSRRLMHYALMKMCKSLEIKFPLDSDDLTALPPGEQLNTPTLTSDQVHLLIQFAKMHPREYITSLLFLSTIYGVRSVEMTNIEVGDDQITVFVAKKRGGVVYPRIHALPLYGYMDGYEHKGEGAVIEGFHTLVNSVGLEIEGAWHSVRRAVTTELHLSNINPVLIARFMRWEVRNVQGGIFAGLPPEVSTYFHLPLDQIDSLVFDKHPFLEMWR